MDQNYYELLGVGKNATREEIRESFQNLLKKWHPDKHSGKNKEIASKKTAGFTMAYQTLYNPSTRTEYDASLNPFPGYPGYQGYNQFGGFHNAGFNAYGGGYGREHDSPLDQDEYNRKMKEVRASMRQSGIDLAESEDSDDEEEEQDEIQKQMAEYAKNYGATGLNVDITLDLSLEEIYKGCTKRIKIPVKRGNGKIEPEINILKIKMNTDDGEIILVEGAGHMANGADMSTSNPGDAIIHIRIKDHPRFKRFGYDLHTTVDISLDESNNGFWRKIKGIDGKSFEIHMTGMKRSDVKFVEKNKGMKKSITGKENGDLIINFAVVFDEKDLDLDEDTIKYLKDKKEKLKKEEDLKKTEPKKKTELKKKVTPTKPIKKNNPSSDETSSSDSEDNSESNNEESEEDAPEKTIKPKKIKKLIPAKKQQGKQTKK